MGRRAHRDRARNRRRPGAHGRLGRPGRCRREGPLVVRLWSLELRAGRPVVADRLLLAGGRSPRTDDLGLAVAGAALEESGAIAVDARCRVLDEAAAPIDGLFAVGDATAASSFTHSANYQARVVAAQVAGRGYDADYVAVPRAVLHRPRGLLRRADAGAGGRAWPRGSAPRASTWPTSSGPRWSPAPVPPPGRRDDPRPGRAGRRRAVRRPRRCVLCRPGGGLVGRRARARGPGPAGRAPAHRAHPGLPHVVGGDLPRSLCPGPRDAGGVSDARHVRVAIVGAGFGGLGAAIRLMQSGERDLVILEQADDIGGTWRDNTYPGCACDVPSHLYSFSFAPNPDWTARSPGSRRSGTTCATASTGSTCARTCGSASSCSRRPGTTRPQRWSIRTSDGELTARRPRRGDRPAQSSRRCRTSRAWTRFAGTVFHSARWRHDHDLTGRRWPSSAPARRAIQFVPRDRAGRRAATVFQRTPPWIMPRSRPRSISRWEHAAYRRFPVLQRLSRAAVYLGPRAVRFGFLHPRIARLQQRIGEAPPAPAGAGPAAAGEAHARLRDGLQADPDLQRLLPGAGPGQRSSGDPERSARCCPHAVVTADGAEHAGRHDHLRHRLPRHRPCRSPTASRPGRSHAGRGLEGSPCRPTAAPPSPGSPTCSCSWDRTPGSGTTRSSDDRGQISHLLAALRPPAPDRGRARSSRPRPRSRRFVREVDRRMRGSVWTAGGCAAGTSTAPVATRRCGPASPSPFRRRLRTLRGRRLPADAPQGRRHERVQPTARAGRARHRGRAGHRRGRRPEVAAAGRAAGARGSGTRRLQALSAELAHGGRSGSTSGQRPTSPTRRPWTRRSRARSSTRRRHRRRGRQRRRRQHRARSRPTRRMPWPAPSRST